MESRKTILLVEDEALIAMNEKMELEKQGYIVHYVPTGEKAVQAILDNVLPVDLILMDINLGSGIDGTKAAEQILNYKDIPVVFLSSHTEPEVVEKTEKITSYGYVVKNSGIVVLDTSIKMAFKLFNAKMEHKQKEEDLRKSDHKYRMLFENMNIPFGLHEAIYDDNGNPVDYRYLDMNPMFLNNLGCKASEIRGHTAKELYPETEQYWIDTFGEAAKTGQSVSFLNYSRELDQWFNTFVFSPQKDQFGVFFIDITEQKKAEEALKKSEKCYRLLTETTSDIIFQVDLNGYVTFCTPIACEILGFTQDEIIGSHFIHFFPESWFSFAQENFKQVIETRTGMTVEVVINHKSGKEIPVNVLLEPIIENAKVMSIRGNVRDITERKRMERELNASIMRHHELEARIPVGVYILWIRANGDKEFEYVSDRWCEFHGVSKEDVIADPAVVDSLVHPDDCEGFFKLNRKSAEQKKPFIWEGRFFNGDEEVRWFHIESTPLLHENGDIRWFGITQDITERKKHEEAIQKALKEKDFLMKELNHRVKNNLAMVSSLISLKNSSLGDDVDLSDLDNRINAIRLIHEKLYQIEDISHINLKEYIHELVLNVFSLSKKHVEIEEHIDDIFLSTKSAIPLGLIINEISTNAMKHGFTAEGDIRFSIDLTKNKNNNQYILIISNTGKPFPKDVTLDYSNTLGLQLISSLVGQLEGTIELEREPHPVFTIRFSIGEE